MSSTVSSTVAKNLPSSIRKLCKFGVEALKPQFVNNKWRPAAVNQRKAARIRKTAVVEGTYGHFDKETGIGWDPSWDKDQWKFNKSSNDEKKPFLDGAAATGNNIGRLQPPKETKRQRTRETRAVKIETLLEGMDERIERYREELKNKKPPGGIVNDFKRLSGRRK